MEHWRLFTIFPAGRAKDNPELRIAPEQYRRLMDYVQVTDPEAFMTVYSVQEIKYKPKVKK